MEKEKDLNWQFSVRTDLAIESREMLESDENDKVDGVEVENEEHDNIFITHVKILNESGSTAMGKPIGNYITIEADKMKENDVECHEEIMKIVADNIVKLAKLKEDSVILVVGLGNWNITPDALGPKVISKVLVTRHLVGDVPEQIEGHVRPVAAVAPGVMGLTGIETSEIIQGIVDRLHPDLVIAIDALAARKLSRINATIQMSDAGISPGAGVGNKRKALNKETLGVPVIALGVPTVVDAATLVNDTMDRMLGQMIENATEGSEFYKMLNNLDSDEKYQLIIDILDPYAGNMFVTPKEVDAVVDRLANIIANSINIAMHPGITVEDINRYTH